MAPQTSLRDQVENILDEEPETRNSDTLLTVRIMEKWYGATWERMDRERIIAILRAVNQETVKRWRAHLQNDKRKFLPTRWDIAKFRGWKQDDWKQALGYSTLTPADHVELAEQERHLKSIQQTIPI